MKVDSEELIDIHSHILPGIDDGSKDIEESLEMIRMAKNSGTSTIIATPHYFPMKGFEVEFDKVKELCNELRERVQLEGMPITIKYGQEVAYSSDILRWYMDGTIGCINESKYMLIELPLGEFSVEEVLSNIYELQVRGVVPILAHPERYREFQNNHEVINKFIDEGFLFQLNIGSLNGDFGRSSKKLSEILVKNGIYSFCGSDAHNTSNRTTDMSVGIESLSKLSPKYKRLMVDNAKKMINGENVRFSGNKIKKKSGLLSIFSR